jgi:2-amino-4-ketopentanoate thiolase alpha subunit
VTSVTEEIRAREGDWVEVECKLLDPADRSKNLPPETAEKPLMMWVKGFAQGEAGMGEELTVETITGRRVTGALSAVNPGYYITYGPPIPELTHVGRDLRRQLAEWRRAQDEAGGASAAGPSSAAGPAGGCGCGCGCSPAPGGEC